jgi:hypothetical protein
MFSKRSPLDFMFVAGAFLLIESLVSFQWYDFFFFGSIGFENNVPVTLIQNVILFSGIILMSASIALNSLKIFGRERAQLPSRRLFADFAVVEGLYLGVVGLFYFGNCSIYCGFPDGALTLSTLLSSPILISSGVYLWRREKKLDGRPKHSLGWEIFSTITISLFLIDIFVLYDNMPGLPLFAILPNILVSGVFASCVFAGLYALHIEEKEPLTRPPAMSELIGNFSMRRVKLFLLMMITTVIVASSAISLYASSQSTSFCRGAFGIYGCNVQTTTLSYATLYSGTTANSSSSATSYLVFELNNPGSSTTITSLTLSGGSLQSVISSWSSSSDAPNSRAINAERNMIAEDARAGIMWIEKRESPANTPISAASSAIVGGKSTYPGAICCPATM